MRRHIGLTSMFRGMSVLIGMAAALCFVGCTDRIPVVGLGLDDSYTISRMQWLRLSSGLTAERFRWSVCLPDGNERVLSVAQECLFVSASEGE